MIEGDKLLKVSEVVKIMKVSRSHVYQLIDCGKLEAYNIAERNGYRIKNSTLNKYLNGCLVDFA